MQDHPRKPEQQNPADIAREAFRRLAVRRIAPTPESYREIYEEIAGAKSHSAAEKVLTAFAADLKGGAGETAALASFLVEAAVAHDWQSYGRHLHRYAEKHLLKKAVDAPVVPEPPSPPSPAMSLVDPANPAPPARVYPSLVEETAAGVESIRVQAIDPPGPALPGKQSRILREMLVRTLRLAVASLLHGAPEMAAEAEQLAREVDAARTEHTLEEVQARLKQFCFRIELKGGDMAEEQELLLRLFRLLLENVGELTEDDAWLNGQVASVHEILSGPISYVSLLDATRCLKEVIYKQSMLKHGLTEAKNTLKDMVLTFIDRLGSITASTGEYHERIDRYSQQIGKAKNITELNSLLNQVMDDTRSIQTAAKRSLDDMVATREDAQAAEARIQELQSQLVQLSELVREDQLTGSLNRRGLDDVLEREFARSDRRGHPLCVAMLDLDDFKRLNDTHGHTAGDQALIHLVRVVKETLRAMDVIGRFGGEEFMIVLPDTPLDDASKTVTRVQRELTKRIFMHNQERLLITFSAGVALRKTGEEQIALIARADKALYAAKKAGKNRVVAADDGT